MCGAALGRHCISSGRGQE